MSPRILAIGLLVILTVAAHGANSPLATAPSEFVRAQASSAVKWQPWTEAALAEAKRQNKPIYVFIGSPLSELTRATIAQTFGSEKTVSWLNESFTCLFVDADAQPDVAALGQHFINSVKQLRGQPVHLWLTPDEFKPYDGANYLPPSEEWGKPGFLKAARAALETWSVDPARARALANEAIEMMRLPAVDLAAEIEVEAKLTAAAKAWTAAADPVNGGFGSAPKMPEPELIRFLLTRDAPAREAAIKAARALVNGALRDPVDGGFYRRCVDEAWKEPYYQKTLADQARIALALFDAAEAAQDPKLHAAGVGALEFALRHLKNSDGTVAAALDGTAHDAAGADGRPAFVKAGSASTQALSLLTVALVRSGDSRFLAENIQHLVKLPNRSSAAAHREFKPVHSAESQAIPSAGDLLAIALASKLLDDAQEAAASFRKLANEVYFDRVSGTYQAIPAELPAGIAVRVPAAGETPSADVLALLGGVDADTANLIRRNLMNQIEYDELPPGDILLGLSQR